MKLVTTKTIAKVAAVATGLAMFTAVSTFALSAQAAALTPSQVSAIVSLLQSFGANSTTIANVQASLNGQPTTTTTTTTSTGGSCSFTRDLTVGSSGADVTALQNWLISKGYSIPAGATGYFGGQTTAAVVAWQKAAGVTPAAGYFGAKSRAAANCSSSTTTTTTGSNPGTGNGLKVSLAPTSPSGSVLVQGQGIGDLAEFNFGNPTGAPITVTGLTFNRIGVSNDATINNVYLYNGVNRLTDSAGVSNSQFSFTNAAGLFVVPAGSTYTVAVRADISASNTSGQQIGASLVSVASNGTLDSSSSFPVMSGYQTISAANLATVNFNSSTLPSGVSLTVSPQSAYTVWQNTVSISTNPVWLKSMTFTNLGSIDVNSIGNFRLYVDGNQVGTAVPQFNGSRKLTFDLSASPVMLSTQSHVIKVLADVTGGASLTFQLSVQRSSDALFVDSQLNQPVTPQFNGGSFAAVSASTVTVQSVSGSTGISVSKAPTSASNAVSAGASSVALATFNLLASGEAVKINDLYVYASTTGANGAGGINNGKIFFNGVQVGSTRDINEGSTTPTDFALGSSLILPAGQTVTVTIYGDVQNAVGTNLANNSTVQVGLTPSTSNAQGQASLQSAGVPYGTVPSQSVNGNVITISNSSLTASKFSGYANQTIVPGSNNVLLGEFTLSAGSTEGINVNTIGIVATSGAAGEFQNLTLKDMSNGTTLGTTISTLSAGTNSFSLGSNLAIPVSGSKTIGIYGNILANGASVVSLSVAGTGGATSGTGASTGTSANVIGGDVVLQQISVGAGTLTGTLGASNKVSQNVVAGNVTSPGIQVGDFSFSANNSSYTIQKIEIDASTTAAAAISNLTLQYTDVNGAVVTTQPNAYSTTISGNNTQYNFTGLTAYVASNSSADIKVFVNTPTISGGGSALSGLAIVVALAPTNFQAQDQSGTLNTNSGNAIVAAASVMSNSTNGYGTLVVRKSVPAFSATSYAAPTNSAPLSGNTLYQFTISADAAGPVDFDKVSFNIATSTLVVTGWQLYDAANPSIALNAVAANVGGANGTGPGVLAIIPDQVIQIPQGGSKTFILKATSTGTWTTGSSLTINLAQADSTLIANQAASSIAPTTSYNYVWTDRALNSDSTGSAEWTNGYLLRDVTNGTYSFTHS